MFSGRSCIRLWQNLIHDWKLMSDAAIYAKSPVELRIWVRRLLKHVPKWKRREESASWQERDDEPPPVVAVAARSFLHLPKVLRVHAEMENSVDVDPLSLLAIGLIHLHVATPERGG